MATHAVVFLDYPPAVLNILTSFILRIVEETLGHVGAFSTDTAQQECRQRRAPLGIHVGLRHAQLILLVLLLALIVNRRIVQLVLKEAARVVPGLVFIFRMKLRRVFAFL